MKQITCVYVRVSTVGQDVANQIPDLKRWALANGVDAPSDDGWLEKMWWTGGNAIWVADEYTGMTYRRPGYQAMMQEFEAGRIGRLVAWRLDRIGRRATGLHHLFDQCLKRGVGLISLRDGVDLSTPAGRLIAGVLASIAEFECESMKERQAAKLARDRALQADAHRFMEEGCTPLQISVRLRVSESHVAKMLAKPVGVLWYGGREKGVGRIKTCSETRVDELLRQGLKVDEVAAATRASKRTVQRRLAEIRRHIGDSVQVPGKTDPRGGDSDGE